MMYKMWQKIEGSNAHKMGSVLVAVQYSSVYADKGVYQVVARWDSEKESWVNSYTEHKLPIQPKLWLPLPRMPRRVTKITTEWE